MLMSNGEPSSVMATPCGRNRDTYLLLSFMLAILESVHPHIYQVYILFIHVLELND